MWMVYSKDCLEHTDTVVRYLARYTRRIAINNARLIAVDGSPAYMAQYHNLC